MEKPRKPRPYLQNPKFEQLQDSKRQPSDLPFKAPKKRNFHSKSSRQNQNSKGSQGFYQKSGNFRRKF